MSELTFHFLRPAWLLALLPAGWLLWRYWRNQTQGGDWSPLVDAHLLPHLLDQPPLRKQPGWLWLLLLGWLLTVVALAGPVWKKLPEPLYLKESALIILLDVSRSMDANDIVPSRLTHARHKVLDILQTRKEGQTGLIVYTDEAYIVAPLTDDTATIASLVPTLTTDIMPSQGSRLQPALERAAQMLSDAGSQQGHILVITDNIAVASRQQALTSARTLAQQQRTVSVLGIGTTSGSPIPLRNGGFVKDRDGSIVLAKSDPTTLQALATAGGGRYEHMTVDDRDWLRLSETMNNRMTDQLKTSEKDIQYQAWREEGIWLLLPIILLAALSFRRGWLLSVVMCGVLLQPQPGYALDWQSLWRNQNQQAAAAMQQEEYQTAAETFNDPEWQASALYRTGQYQQAAETLAAFDTAEAHYNRGNALARGGDLPGAIKAYEQALTQQHDHTDARHNLELVQSLLEQNQQQGEQTQHDEDSQPQDAAQQDAQQDSQSSAINEQQGQDQQQRQQVQDDSSSADSSATSDQKSQQQSAEQQTPDESQPAAEPDMAPAAQQQPASEEPQQADDAQQETTQQKQQESAHADPELLQQAESQTEQQQAMEQWLRRIPDDPGGLMRRKFLLQHRQQQLNNSESEQPW